MLLLTGSHFFSRSLLRRGDHLLLAAGAAVVVLHKQVEKKGQRQQTKTGCDCSCVVYREPALGAGDVEVVLTGEQHEFFIQLVVIHADHAALGLEYQGAGAAGSGMGTGAGTGAGGNTGAVLLATDALLLVAGAGLFLHPIFWCAGGGRARQLLEDGHWGGGRCCACCGRYLLWGRSAALSNDGTVHPARKRADNSFRFHAPALCLHICKKRERIP